MFLYYVSSIILFNILTNYISSIVLFNVKFYKIKIFFYTIFFFIKQLFL